MTPEQLENKLQASIIQNQEREIARLKTLLTNLRVGIYRSASNALIEIDQVLAEPKKVG